MRLFWGLLFILIGIYIYGLNFSLWNSHNLTEIWHFWPVLLILFGVALLVRPLKWGWIIVLICFAAGVALIYNVLFTSNPVVNIPETSSEGSKTFNFSQNLSANVDNADISIDSGAVSLELSDTPDQLISGTLVSNLFEPLFKTDQKNNKMSVILSTNRNITSFSGTKNDLNVKVTNKIPVNMTLDVGASDINLDLSHIILSGLTVKSGASSLDIGLGSAIQSDANVVVKAGASDIKITIPNEIGVNVTIKSGLSSKELNGFNKIDSNTYRSDNYDKAAKKINLEIDSGVSSITIIR